MPSVIDLVVPGVLGTVLEPGAVVPIEHHASTGRGLWPLGHGGSLYLVTTAKHAIWLVAVLEAPEQSGILRGDNRAPGWYAAPNTTPVTEITSLFKRKKFPATLRPADEDRLRELLDATDAPVVEAAMRDSSPLVDLGGPLLAQAAAHLAASAVKPALDALLEAWRASRAVELADLIDRASRCLPRFDHPLFVDRLDDAACTKTWRATLEADPIGALPQLLRNLRGAGELDRLERLAKLPDDPRISRRIVELLPGYWDTCLPILERGRDARSWDALVTRGGEIKVGLTPGASWAYEEISLERSGRNAFAKKSPNASELTSADRSHVSAVETQLERLEEAARTERDLVDAIADHWKDDDPRLIYADWLIERGHPRGEYLSLILQSAKQLSPAQRRRLALLGEVPYMYGAIDDVATLQRRQRDRGLEDQLDIYWSTPPMRWRSAAHHPLVGLLREIRLVGPPRDGRAEAIVTFVRAAPRLQRITEIGAKHAKPILALLDGAFEHRNGALVRVKARGKPRAR